MKKKIILAVLVSVVGVVSVIAIRIRQVEAQRKAEMEEIAREMREAVKDSQYLGMTEEEVIAKFGEPDKPDGTYNEIGIYWHVWPEVERELGAKPSNTPDAAVRELYWNCKTNVVVVWLVKSNGAWRVAKDITVEDGVVF